MCFKNSIEFDQIFDLKWREFAVVSNRFYYMNWIGLILIEDESRPHFQYEPKQVMSTWAEN